MSSFSFPIKIYQNGRHFIQLPKSDFDDSALQQIETLLVHDPIVYK